MTPSAAAEQRAAFWSRPRAARIGWALWVILAVGITVIVLRDPSRTVTPSYRAAALAFLESRPMYSPGKMGWLYPIQSAMVFVPFAFEPLALSEILWRFLGIGALAGAMWRLARRAAPAGSSGLTSPMPGIFLLASGAVIGAALSAARNGQTNLHLAALFTLACVEVIDRKWWRAALWLCLALAAKPIAIVPLLLFTALHRPLWWRVPVGLLVVAAVPFLYPHWSYVLDQYQAGIHKVLEAGDITDFTEFHPADLTSLLNLYGVPPGAPWLTAVRAAAALAVLGLCWRAKQLFDHCTAAVLTLMLGCAYLMVFNPRTEGNSYVILGPPLAILTCWSLLAAKSPRSIVLVVACVLLASAQLFVPHQREYWIRPAETLLLLAWLAAAIVVPRLRASIPTVESRVAPAAG